jgi:hypothetical protein
MSYDIITKDLCRKAQEDCHAAVERTATLLEDPADRMMVAISASAGSLAAAAGYVAALTKNATGKDVEPAAAVDALWEMIRPLILTTAGGDRAPFERLLAESRP